MQHSKIFSGNQATKEDFLIHRTGGDTDPKDIAEPSASFSGHNIKLPGVRIGKQLIRYALNQMKSYSTFSVLLLRIHYTELKPPIHVREQLWDSLRILMDHVCKRVYGISGLMNSEIFVCFIPNASVETAYRLSQKIQEIWKKHHNYALTQGVAGYPFLDFTSGKILINARKALDHAELLGPGSIAVFDATSLNVSGDKLYQQGKVKEAIEEFKMALMLDPSHVNVHNSLGVCYGAIEDYENAINEFQTVATLKPDEAMAWYNAGMINLLLNQTDKALANFLKASVTGSGIFEIIFQIGKLYLQQKEYEAARQYLEKAVALKNDSASAYRCLGECYEALKINDRAVRAFQKAIKLQPFDAVSLSSLGYLLDMQGENLEITSLFCEHAVNISPDNGLYRHRLGKLYMKQNRVKEALKEFAKAMELGYKE